MAIAIDGSTPAGASQPSGTTATVQSAAFSPPAGSVVLISWQGNTAVAAPSGSPTITNTGGLTFTLVNHRFKTDAGGKEGQAAMWRAVVGSAPGSMTVTVTTLTASGDRHARVKPIVVTGVDTSNPAGWQAGEGTDVGGALDGLAYTSTSANSMGFASVSDWDTASSTFTAAAGTTVVDSAQVGASINCATLRQTAPTTSGATITLGLTSPTSTTWNYVWIELPASSGSSVSAGLAAGTGTASTPAPSVSPAAAPAAATGAANTPLTGKQAAAGNAAATASTNTPSTALSCTAAAAAATGTAYGAAPTNGFSTGAASATGTAAALTPSIATDATAAATGTGAAGSLATAASFTAGLAAGTATALDATCGTAATTVPAGLATGTGAALNTALGGGAELTIFGATSGPGAQATDSGNYTLAIEFYVTSSTTMAGVRFWASGTVSGSDHASRVYSVDPGGGGGTLVGGTSAAFPSPLVAGWNEARFASPVSLTANQRYRAAVWFTTDNGYTATPNYWAGGGPGESSIVNDILTAPGKSAAEGTAQGSFNAGADAFPSGEFNAGNYWVDPIVGTLAVVATVAPGLASGAGAAYGATVLVDATASGAAGAGAAHNPTATNGSAVSASAGLASANGASLSLTSNATVTSDAASGSGAAATAAIGSAVSVSAGHASGLGLGHGSTIGAGYETLLGDGAAAPTSSDAGGPVTVGQSLSALTSVTVYGVRYTVLVPDSGTATAVLYDNAGTELASKVGLTSAPAGTYEILFDTPVTLTTTTIYVVGVHHASGVYSYTPSFWSGDFTSPGGHLFTSSAGSYGGGRFAYGASPAFPNGTSSAWYAVDPLVLVVAGTSAPATPATATGTAYTTLSNLANAGLASGVGAVLFDPAGSTVSLELTCDAPITATGAAYNATVPPVGVANGAGTANAPTAQVGPAAGAGAATGTAAAPAVQISKAVASAACTGSALAATVSTSSTSSTGAGRGDALGAALAPTVSASPNAFAAHAAAAGTAANAAALPAPIMATATGTGVASSAAEVKVTPDAQSVIAATGTAYAATAAPDELVAAGRAAASGTANGAASSVTPSAGNAAAAGSAQIVAVNAAGNATVPAGSVAATGAAAGPAPSVTFTAAQASGTTAAAGASAGVAVNAGRAAATGTANNGFAAGASSFAAQATTADAAGNAFALAATASVFAGVAGGDGAVHPLLATSLSTGRGTGRAWQPTLRIASTREGGSWGPLLALVREARNPAPDPREAAACPNDGFVLLPDPHGGHRCPFDGYRR